MNPIYLLFTGNYIDLSRILDVYPPDINYYTELPTISFYITYQLRESPIRYEKYYSFYTISYNPENIKEKIIKIHDEYKELFITMETEHDIMNMQDAILKDKYDSFIADWKSYKQKNLDVP